MTADTAARLQPTPRSNEASDSELLALLGFDAIQRSQSMALASAAGTDVSAIIMFRNNATEKKREQVQD
jgi:hypothetical protein